MKKTEYTLYFTNLPREVKLAVAADQHDTDECKGDTLL